MTAPVSEHTHITDITFYREDGETIVWVDKSGDLPFPRAHRGSHPPKDYLAAIEKVGAPVT